MPSAFRPPVWRLPWLAREAVFRQGAKLEGLGVGAAGAPPSGTPPAEGALDEGALEEPVGNCSKQLSRQSSSFAFFESDCRAPPGRSFSAHLIIKTS